MHKVLLCCIVKMENKYLPEWIIHHKNIGFNKIVIYDNNERTGIYSENSDQIGIVKREISEGFIDKYDVDGAGVQTKCYTDCYEKYKSYDWLFFLDIDEYLIFEKSKNVNEFLSENIFDKYEAIKIPWKIYGDNGWIKSNNNYSIGRFSKESFKYLNSIRKMEVKMAIRGGFSEIKFKNSHSIYPAELKCCDNIGRIKNLEESLIEEPVYKNVWINHYITKSLEEFVEIKLVRCGADKYKCRARYNINYYFKHNKVTYDKLAYIKNKFPKDSYQKIKRQIPKLFL